MAAVLLCAAISASAQAGAPPGQVGVTIYGAGASSCGKWLADRENPIHAGLVRSRSSAIHRHRVRAQQHCSPAAQA